MKSTHFENFSKRTPAFAGVVGGLFLKSRIALQVAWKIAPCDRVFSA